MSADPKVVVEASGSNGSEVVFEHYLMEPTPGFPGYDTRYVTAGSPDRIGDLLETVSRLLRERVLSGESVVITATVHPETALPGCGG